MSKLGIGMDEAEAKASYEKYLKTVKFWQEEGISPTDVMSFIPFTIASVFDQIKTPEKEVKKFCDKVGKVAFLIFQGMKERNNDKR